MVVELFVSETGDQPLIHHAQQSYYGQLSEGDHGLAVSAAVHPPFKAHVVDGGIAVIGSSNMDIRSFSLNLELSLLVHSSSFVINLRVIESEYRAVSRQLTPQEYRARPLRETALRGLPRPCSRWRRPCSQLY